MADGKSTSKEPAPLDLHVAHRIRARRVEIGMSQQKLAKAVGVTFQQVQKYESGRNRLSASRLQMICDALGVLRDYVYEGFSQEHYPATGFAEAGQSTYESEASVSESAELVEAFQRIEDAGMRAHLLAVVKALAVRSSEMSWLRSKSRKKRSL